MSTWNKDQYRADPAFIAQLRSQMLRFATLQLRDEARAEDAVQEALLGALSNAGSFRQRASLKTWVFAILKNKITDALRESSRSISASNLDSDADPVVHLFDTQGAWHMTERPSAWVMPENMVHNEHFWRVFEACLEDLSAEQARLFMMREFLEFETAEICEIAEVSTGNLHVILHRARLRLRECLEKRWFASPSARSLARAFP